MTKAQHSSNSFTPAVEEDETCEFDNSFAFAFDEEPEKTASSTETAPKVTNTKFTSLEERLAQIREEKTFSFAEAPADMDIKKKKKNKAKKKSSLESQPESGSEDELANIEGVSPPQEYFDLGLGVEALGENIDTFSDFNLSRPVLKSLAMLKFERPTPIQRVAIPVALMGKDICGGAVTGSGKTAAFLIPIIERLVHRPRSASAATRVLILLPTRELAVQCYNVAMELSKFTDIRCCLAAGGLPIRLQEADLRCRPEIVIATPGRLIDHIHNSATFSLESVEILVLDEADRMLEEGFADELDEIIRHTPSQRQTILFSATMTDNIDELVRLSLRRPVRLFVDNNTAIARRLVQEFVRIRADRETDRMPVLLALCRRTCTERCIIFFPTKELAHRFRLVLGLVGLRCAEIHGGLTQTERLDALERFKTSAVDFLTATDVAARGLDIQGVRYVLNYSMPVSYKLYLHRVGRTARADTAGCSITLVGEGADRKLLKMVIKNSTAPVKHRLLQPVTIDNHREILTSIAPSVEQLLREEKENRLLNQTEKELERAENIITHKDEISARPKKTWFQTPRQKIDAKKRDRQSLGDDRQKQFKKNPPLKSERSTKKVRK